MYRFFDLVGTGSDITVPVQPYSSHDAGGNSLDLAGEVQDAVENVVEQRLLDRATQRSPNSSSGTKWFAEPLLHAIAWRLSNFDLSANHAPTSMDAWL